MPSATTSISAPRISSITGAYCVLGTSSGTLAPSNVFILVHFGNRIVGYMLQVVLENMLSAIVTFSEPITSPNPVISQLQNICLTSLLPLRSSDFMRSLRPVNSPRGWAFLSITIPLTSRRASIGAAASASDESFTTTYPRESRAGWTREMSS